MDRLSTLLSKFGIRANLFYNDTLNGYQTYRGLGNLGRIHLLQSGSVSVRGSDNRETLVAQPSLIFLPRPYHHTLFARKSDSARLVCAAMDFEGGSENPFSLSLPDMLILPLTDLVLLNTTLTWMFEEAAQSHCGKDAVINRLFEILIILLLRYLLDQNQLKTGLMAGLADPKLVQSLVHIHEAPSYPWTIEEMADRAHMSRSSFAAHFRTILGQTPAEYLLSWRISLAQKMIREGRAMSLIASDIGYESPSALSRAFRRKTGMSPREWLKSSSVNEERT